MALKDLKLSALLFGAALAADPPAVARPARPDVAAAPSVLHCLNDLNRDLERSLLNLRSDAGADGQLRALAAHLIATVGRHPDVATAAVLLNQIAGP
ncbi:MAG: hypothetical protein ACLGI6_09095, partial [Gammaproteobacteria bacterium]